MNTPADLTRGVPRHIVLAAVLDERHGKSRVVDRAGFAVEHDLADRFRREVLSSCPACRGPGYVVAFGTVGETCSIDALAFARTDPHRIAAQARADAARLRFTDISDVLAIFESAARIHEPAVRLSLIDRTVSVDRAPFDLTPREFDIVSILALRRRPVPTDHLADAIWPDADPWNAKSTLKVVVHRLGRRLGTRLIVCRDRTWSLRAGTVVDLWEWSDAATEALQSTASPEARLRAAELYDAMAVALEKATPAHAPTETALRAIVARVRRRLEHDKIVSKDSWSIASWSG